ncbi:hypothetical protein FACS1894162_2140 [Bacteroidia bacterium]|nr:hypothetical protein FACS1894162_2140 [Bacteroidia bacterium]
MKAIKRFLFIGCIAGCAVQMQAQDMPFNDGEVLHFTVNYKYGLVNVKGGSAVYRSNLTTYKGKPAIKTELMFKTTSFVDKVVMNMRDTLLSYTSLPDLTPLFHYRSVYEGSHHYVEDMYIQKHGIDYTETLVKKTKANGEVQEMVTQATNVGYDFLNLFIRVRMAASIMQVGESHNLSALMGEKVIAMTVHYAGKTTVNKNTADWFTVDIIDSKTFTSSKNAMEVWVGDNENRAILKVKAKLKIGAVEATLTSYKSLKDENQVSK